MAAEILEIRQLISAHHATIEKLEDKIDEKLALIEYDEEKLKGGNKSAVTNWRNKVTKIEADITECKAEIVKVEARLLKAENKESSNQDQSGGGSQVTGVSKAVKNLTRDIEAQPKFAPPLDVSVFARTMTMVWNTHVKNNKSIEADFVSLCEGRIDQVYRIPMQSYTEDNGSFSTWAEMKTYLLSTHRSCTTIFQELSKLDQPRRHNEKGREYARRLNQIGDDALTIISAKFKQITEQEMGVTDLFEIMKCGSYIRMMQNDSNLREVYNQIAQHLDETVTLDELAQKSSAVVDRQVSAEAETYMASKVKDSNQLDSLIEKFSAMEKKMTLLAKSNGQESKSSGEHKSKKKSSKPSTRVPMSEWSKDKIESVRDVACLNITNRGTCERKVCHFHPCNRKSSGQSMFTKKDF